MSNEEWPRLSVDLPGMRHLFRCQSCEVTATIGMGRWQEHDGDDRPEPIILVLCDACADRLIEPHPRLYRRLGRNEPFPGAMRLCLDCMYRDKLHCLCSLSRYNGGEGLRFPGPDTNIHVDGVRNGRRFGQWLKGWSAEPGRCEGKEIVPWT